MRLFGNQPRWLAVLVIFLMFSAGATNPPVNAQSSVATPTPDSDPDAPKGWPASIYPGECDTSPEPAYALTDVTPYNVSPPITARGSAKAAPVYISQTRLDVTLDRLLDSSNSILVQKSTNSGSLEAIACGEIGGITIERQLLIGIKPLEHSGISGVVQLVSEESGTTITVLLTQSEPASTGATSDGTGGAEIDDESSAEPTETPADVPEEPSEVIPEEVACDTASEDCNGDGVVDDLEGPACDPYYQDCDGDGFIDIPSCDPYAEDCDGDGIVDIPGCDPYIDDCDGDGFIDIPS